MKTEYKKKLSRKIVIGNQENISPLDRIRFLENIISNVIGVNIILKSLPYDGMGVWLKQYQEWGYCISIIPYECMRFLEGKSDNNFNFILEYTDPEIICNLIKMRDEREAINMRFC